MPFSHLTPGSSGRALRVLCLFLCSAVFLFTQAALAAEFEGKVVSVGVDFGNLDTDIAVEPLKLRIGQPFSFHCRDAKIDALYVEWYADVDAGEWLGLANDRGQLQLSVSYGDANSVSGCGMNDAVTVITGG